MPSLNSFCVKVIKGDYHSNQLSMAEPTTSISTGHFVVHSVGRTLKRCSGERNAFPWYQTIFYYIAFCAERFDEVTANPRAFKLLWHRALYCCGVFNLLHWCKMYPITVSRQHRHRNRHIVSHLVLHRNENDGFAMWKSCLSRKPFNGAWLVYKTSDWRSYILRFI